MLREEKSIMSCSVDIGAQSDFRRPGKRAWFSQCVRDTNILRTHAAHGMNAVVVSVRIAPSGDAAER
jgi:hypothetical protein